jgi:YD repeat-containing protein
MKIQLLYRLLYTADEIYSLQFKKKNGEVVRVKETDRHFTIVPGQAAVRGYVIKKNFNVRSVSDVQIIPDEWEFSPYDAAYYELISGWKYLDQETVTDYDLNGTNPIVVQNSYTYNPSTQLMSSTSRLLSDGSTRSAEYFYSADYASVPGLDPAQASILSQMNVTGNTAAPVLTLSKVNGNVIEASRIDYQYSPQTNHIVPSVINTFNTVSQTYEPTVRLQAFNEADRLTMTSKSGASPVSYHWRSDNTSPNAMANNASPSEFYSENYEENPSSTVELAHSGYRYTTSISVGWAAPNGKTYLIFYWYRLSGKWYQARTGYNGTSHILSGGGAYDDVNIYPVDALITSYTFEPLVGMTGQTDGKGLSTSYEYDGFGRLLLVKDHNGDIVKHLAYNYVIPAVITYGNDALSQVFTRSNCAAGQIPGQITYTIQANTYTVASKSAASALAQADINTNGQAFANANAVCTTCSGNDKEIINGIRETGIKVYISSIPKPGEAYQHKYHYKFSDNTLSIEYVEQNIPSPRIPE